ncbi:MAG: hypothetical protein ABSG57_10235 [Candidatus Bathyarchaeia archaeon]|jgi:hypothetical protein
MRTRPLASTYYPPTWSPPQTISIDRSDVCADDNVIVTDTFNAYAVFVEAKGLLRTKKRTSTE